MSFARAMLTVVAITMVAPNLTSAAAPANKPARPNPTRPTPTRPSPPRPAIPRPNPRPPVIEPVAAVGSSASDSIAYRAKAGDTLELLAAEYYGDRNHAVFIMVANKILHPRPLKVGEVLKIPISREVTTSPGDTFETLAQSYLGDSRRASFLAEFNGISSEDTVAAGATILVPFHVEHVAAAEESLSSIAAAYFGNSKNADMLRRYNFLEKDSISNGEKIVVPIFHVRVRSSKLPPMNSDARARGERRRLATDQAAAALPVARAAWRSGDYLAVKRNLASVDVDYLDAQTAIDVGMLLGAVYVAFDDVETALATYKHVIDRRSKLELDEYSASPKVREVWQRAGGKVTPPTATP
jgi:LysM repeat protein